MIHNSNISVFLKRSFDSLQDDDALTVEDTAGRRMLKLL